MAVPGLFLGSPGSSLAVFCSTSAPRRIDPKAPGWSLASPGAFPGSDEIGSNCHRRPTDIVSANAGSDLPFERLLRHVWGDWISGDRQALKQLVHRLRQKIEAQPAEPRYLLSAAGVGYRLEVEVGRGE